jgi:hypothetical protein
MTTLAFNNIVPSRRVAIALAAAVAASAGTVGLVSGSGDTSHAAPGAAPAAVTSFQGPDPAVSKNLQVGPAPSSSYRGPDPVNSKSLLR